MEVRDQGLYFIESMGFIMENTDFRKLPDSEKLKLIESLPPFHLDLSKFKKSSKKEENNQEDDEDVVEVEVLEEDLETIHEFPEEPRGIVAEEEQEKRLLSPEMLKEAMEKDRNLKIFFLFLAGL